MAKTIRFTEGVVFRREGKPDIVFEEGKEYTLRDDRARRWINRNVAVEVKEGKIVPNKVEPTPAEQKATPFPPVNFQASQDSVAFAKGGNDGDAVAGSADVPGKDGGGSGERAQHVAGSGRGGSRGGRSRTGNK